MGFFAYRFFSSTWMKASGGITPSRRSISLPSLKKITVGIFITVYRMANSPSSSVLTFPTMALPSYFSARLSMTGPSIWQGPHQSAQKSTIISLPSSRLLSKVSLLKWIIAIFLSFICLNTRRRTVRPRGLRPPPWIPEGVLRCSLRRQRRRARWWPYGGPP